MSDKFRNQNDPADKIFDSIVRDPTRHRLEEAEKIHIAALEQFVQGKLEGMQSWLKQQLDFNAGITENLSDGVFAISRAGIVTFINPEAERLLGSSRQEMMGQSVCEICYCLEATGGMFSSNRHILFSAMDSGEILHVEEYLFRRKDGTSFPVSFTASPLRL